MLLIALFTSLRSGENHGIVTVAFLILLAMLHLQRSDRVFLKIHFDNHKRILLMQYLILSLPVILLLAYYRNWLMLAVLAGVIFLMPYLEIKMKVRFHNFFLIGWLPDACFEWKAGLRKSFPVALAALLGGLAFSFFTGAVPIALFVLGLLPVKFFEKGEPVQMLISGERSAGRLILGKFRLHSIIFTLLCFPLIAAFLVFHAGLWYIVLAEFFLFLSLHLYFIVIKYAFYIPNEKAPAMEAFAGFGAVGIVIPVLLPLVWILTAWMFFRARRNLKPYLHDFD